jgi:YggT family protein
MTSALYYIVRTLAQLFIMLLVLRFWLPMLRADFRNPLAQGILRLTAPLITPVRRILPSIGRLDTATILIAFVAQFLAVLLLLMLSGQRAPAAYVAWAAALELIILSLNIFFFAIIIRIILSWVAPHTYNPVSAIVIILAEPVLAPFRRVIPPIGGIDISPIFALILLQAAQIFLQTLMPLRI